MLHSARMKTAVPAPARSPRARRAGLLAVLVAATALLGGGSPATASLVTNRVVGGAAVPTIASFPYQVALYIRGTAGPFGQFGTLAFCGGVIIDQVQIVTAAHCVTDDSTGQPVSPATVTVQAGTATLPQGVPVAPVATSIAVDPEYNPRTADSDVAVVTLATPLYTGTPR
jgi:secreted trypsin-like serine protease